MEGLEPQHGDILAALREFQQQQLFSDFTIHLKEGPVKISKILIAAMSHVFKKMLTVDMAEKRDNEVDMKHVTMETWTCITQFYFSTQKLVSVENVVEVIEVCDMYQLERLKQFCADFLLSCCSPENCLAVKRIATQFSLEDVTQKAIKVLAENLSAVCKSEEILCLEKSELLEVLEKEELDTTEDDLCEGLLAWMEAKNADAATCTELFKYIHMKNISDACLGIKVLYHAVTVRVPDVQSEVQQEITRRFQLSRYKQVQVRPRRRRVQNASSNFFVLGWNTYEIFCMFFWSPEEKKWTSVPGPQPVVETWFSAVEFEGTIVVTGGDDSKDTHLFDLRTRTWAAGPDLLQSRQDHGMAVIGGTVYVVGGWSGGLLTSIEEYSRESGRWSHTGDLQTTTDDCGVTALGETILVVGGETDEAERLIQTFNVETRTSAVLDVQLPRPMRHVEAASLGNTAYFVGSQGDLVQISEVKGSLQMTSYVQLVGFVSKKWFGLSVEDGCVRVMGGEWSQSVVCWNLQGEKVEACDVAELPEEMSVDAAFLTEVPRD